VSPETIYKAFGTKAELAKAVFDLVIGGDEDLPVSQQAQARAIRAEPDVGRKVTMYVDGYVERAQRSASVQMLIRDGRHVDESLGIVWQQLMDEALRGMGMLARHLAETGRLQVSVEEARDILWNYISVDQYERLVLQRGWSIERFATWLRQALNASLLA
jgi:AcrR family transcriptional regulator